MTSKVVPLNKEQHKGLKLKPEINLTQFENANSTTVALQELPFAAVELPLVFVKGKEDDFVCIALMGDKEAKNYYLKDGKTRGNFIPASFTHYPLGLTPNPKDKEQVGVVIDIESKFVSETEGEAMFNEDGSETEFFSKRVQSMLNYFNSMRAMREFTGELAKHDLLIPQGVKFGPEDSNNEVSGFFIVDEKKFNELSSEVFEEFRKKGYIGLIYTHLVSLKNIAKLASYINSKDA